MGEIMLRTSERNTFKQCQWKWEREYQDRLKSKHQKADALWFGTGIHLALEKWYVPGKKRGANPVETWMQYVEDTAADTTFINTNFDGDSTLAVEAGELGKAMLYSYIDEYGEDEHMEVLATEMPFTVGIRYKTLSGDTKTARYVGTMDLVYRDLRDGKVFALDHKGLRMSEQVMTPKGWERNGDLQVGDFVIGSDGKGTKVTGVYNLGMRAVYRVHMSDGSFVDTTDDHLWTLGSYHGRSRIVTTQDIIDDRFRSYRILPEQPVIEWEEKELPIDPYTLGVVLGDGNLRNGSPQVSSDDLEVMEKVAQVYQVTKRKPQPGKCQDYGILGLNSLIRELGLADKRSKEKFIPESYLYGSVSQRKALLAGLLDTDGHVDTHKRIKFCTTSEALKDGVEHLVRSLGGRAQSSEYEAYYTKDGEKVVTGTYWHVSIRMKECPFTLPRHVERFVPARSLTRTVSYVEKIGEDEMRCIRVAAEDSLYMTKHCIITHNTCRQLGSANTQYLRLDDQAGAYYAVAATVLRDKGLIGPKEAIAGIDYNYLVKAMPDDRPRNKEGYATNKPTKKHYLEQLPQHGVEVADKMTVKQLQELAEQKGIQVFGDVSANQPPKRFERVRVRRSQKEQVSQIRRIVDDLTAMQAVRDGTLKATKAPSRNCTFCPFRDICELDEDGRDYTDMAAELYATWDPYEAHRKENA